MLYSAIVPFLFRKDYDLILVYIFLKSNIFV